MRTLGKESFDCIRRVSAEIRRVSGAYPERIREGVGVQGGGGKPRNSTENHKIQRQTIKFDGKPREGTDPWTQKRHKTGPGAEGGWEPRNSTKNVKIWRKTLKFDGKLYNSTENLEIRR